MGSSGAAWSALRLFDFFSADAGRLPGMVPLVAERPFPPNYKATTKQI